MLLLFKSKTKNILAVECEKPLKKNEVEALHWLFGDAELAGWENGNYIGPRAEMVTPFSTNAVEITQNMGIDGISRIEEFYPDTASAAFDPMLQRKYKGISHTVFESGRKAEKVMLIDDIKKYNLQEGLALSPQEEEYLEKLSEKLGRKLTDSEVFGFSQVNSEHCRHKIFNGTFIIDGKEQDLSLFQLIRLTSQKHGGKLVSAYKDNVAFIEGTKIEQFAPQSPEKPSLYLKKDIESVISMKAETHNFPTTVEPFNGAATGSGGEIRDRLAGGKGSLPLAGTAVYMTSYTRLGKHEVWEIKERPWLYQSPLQILLKASNGASDFGNKFGQPLICGSVFTFENEENGTVEAFDKVIMLAGGVGYAKKADAQKDLPEKGDKIVILGGDNYRIGMGGGAVSSVNTGQYACSVELNAIQRSNPEMQKRAANTIRAYVESDDNKIVSIHDHGAGGHLNCLSELVEATGGKIDLDALPAGDKSLSAKEIIGNESQERMGLVIKEKELPLMERIAERERCPMYVVGEATGDMHFSFESKKTSEKPIDMPLEDMFGNSPKTVIKDRTVKTEYSPLLFDEKNIVSYIENVLRLEAVACKDYLTNKADRCVGGRVARQQCVGELQLPLADCGVVALDYTGTSGIAVSIGSAPAVSLISPAVASRLAISEALTNIVFAPVEGGLQSVFLSANWQWPCKNPGQDARLYQAVKAASDFAIELGINIPTGKDSLSMTQKYPDGQRVMSPGTLIVSATAQVSDVKLTLTPVLKKCEKADIVYIPFSKDAEELGGTSFAQSLGRVGQKANDASDAGCLKQAFAEVQSLIKQGQALAGHDVSAGGLVTTLLEMCFPSLGCGAEISLDAKSLVTALLNEKPGVVLQLKEGVKAKNAIVLGRYKAGNTLKINSLELDIARLRKIWYEGSYLIDRHQSGEKKARERFETYEKTPLAFKLPEKYTGVLPERPAERPLAAILREKGSNSEREMAHALYLAGFDVIDVHTTDLTSGREDLSKVRFLAAVGGFSNSDVLGSAKGWAGALKYNDKARKAISAFFSRADTLSIGICNGCQLFVELDLLKTGAKMLHNDSHKFECGFVGIEIPESNSVMLGALAGAKLGCWAAHGEGKFSLPKGANIAAKFAYDSYPANPNGSYEAAAAICSADGRHLAIMPHPERSIFSWNWAYAPEDMKQVSPWLDAFIAARKWLEKNPMDK